MEYTVIYRNGITLTTELQPAGFVIKLHLLYL